jgi:hypothetical protein
MRRRASVKFQPAIERIERRQLLSGSAAASVAAQVAEIGKAAKSVADSAGSSRQPIVPTKFLVYRITNPQTHPVNLIPPFGHVLVQSAQPVPGQVYNVLYVVVKNDTKQTFTASSGFSTYFPGGTKVFPILTGNETWLPGKWIVFYVLTKKYYPLRSQVAGGFELFLGGRRSTLVPGPSGIFLRLKYNPATFDRTLDWIVAHGQGAQLGNGSRIGMPDTAINRLTAGRTNRIDFAGHF